MPFCPKCRDEFQDWVKVCPDCKVELVEKLEPVPKPVKTEYGPHQNLTTIATFYFPTEAHIVAAKLESQGIWAFVADEHIINTNWLFSNAIGGVKVLVRESDAKKAIQILRTSEKNPQDVSYAGERCPQCNSVYIQYETYNLRLVFGLWFISFIFMGSSYGGGIILPFFKRKWKCNTCGYQWKNKK